METWGDPLNPGEIKNYKFNWSNDLGDDDTIVAASAEFVPGYDGGVTLIDTDNFSDVYSEVIVSGGTAGLVALIKGHVETAGGNHHYQVGQLKVVDPATAAARTAFDIEADIAAVRAARTEFMTTGAVKEISRDGRKIVRNTPTSLEDFTKAIADLQRELAEVNVLAGATALRPHRALRVRF